MEKRTDRGGYIIRLSGMPLMLRYTLNDLCAMEVWAGMPLDELMNRHFSATRLLLWAGLRQDHPQVTLWDVGDMLGAHLQRGGTLAEVAEMCARALRASGLLDEAEDEEA